MSNQEDQRRAQDLHYLGMRLQDLREQLAERAESTHKKRRRFCAVGFGLILVATVSLAYVTTMAFQLDAHAVTQIGRLEVEKHLPSGREGLARHLNESAPSVVKHALESLVELMPELRTVLMRDIQSKLEAITAEGESLLQSHTEESIVASRARLQAQFPGLSEEEQLALVVSTTATNFRESMKQVLEELHPLYSAEIGRVQSFVDRLGTEEESDLSEKERIQKELVETLLKLIVLEQSEYSGGI